MAHLQLGMRHEEILTIAKYGAYELVRGFLHKMFLALELHAVDLGQTLKLRTHHPCPFAEVCVKGAQAFVCFFPPDHRDS